MTSDIPGLLIWIYKMSLTLLGMFQLRVLQTLITYLRQPIRSTWYVRTFFWHGRFWKLQQTFITRERCLKRCLCTFCCCAPKSRNLPSQQKDHTSSNTVHDGVCPRPKWLGLIINYLHVCQMILGANTHKVKMMGNSWIYFVHHSAPLALII